MYFTNTARFRGEYTVGRKRSKLCLGWCLGGCPYYFICIGICKSPLSFTDEFVLSLDGNTFALKVVGVSLGTALLPSILTEEILPTTPALDTFIVTFLETPPTVAVRVVDLLYSTSPSPPSRPVTVPEASTTAIDLSAISQVRSPVYAPAGTTFVIASCVVEPSLTDTDESVTVLCRL